MMTETTENTSEISCLFHVGFITNMADEDKLSTAEVENIETEKQTLPPIYKEIFFIDNGSQSNIYCSSILHYPSTAQERFLVGTLRGKVSCLERSEDHYAKEKFHSSHDMQAREVYFSYIPGLY